MIISELDFYTIMIAQSIFIGVATIILIQLWFKDGSKDEYSFFQIIFHYFAYLLTPNLIFIPLFFGLKYLLV